jgi:uncharacterized DUF497 family protein
VSCRAGTAEAGTLAQFAAPGKLPGVAGRGCSVARDASGIFPILGFLWINRPVNTWDEAERRTTFAERGLDFAEAELVFAGRVMTLPDERRDYRERRFVTAGWLRGRFVVVVWTPRGDGRRIISMRHGHADEEAYYREQMD